MKVSEAHLAKGFSLYLPYCVAGKDGSAMVNRKRRAPGCRLHRFVDC
ncbi:MAG: hypothetical protein ABSE48_06645 [Verrucomicrobiota bacterium]